MHADQIETVSLASGYPGHLPLRLAGCIVALILVALPALACKGTATHKLLLFSDVHFNPMADPSLVHDLENADPSQWEAILKRSQLSAFSGYGQDTNWWLLKSALTRMQAALPHPALIIYTGDMLAHDFRAKFLKATGDEDWGHYRAFVLRTVQFVSMQLQQRFPGTEVLLAPGNDDDDCGDYTVEPNGAFLSDTASIVRDLARGDEALLSGWRSLGSYVVPHPTVAKLRIISLNTVFLSNQYQPKSFAAGCTAVHSNAANELLTWLHTQLEQARQNGERVWLMFHIPPGIDGYATTHHDEASSQSTMASCPSTIVPMWMPNWTSQFDTLLEEYRTTVIASFAGHTHMDDFRVIGGNADAQVFVLISPAVSPIFKQNPAFRIVNFARDGSVFGQSTYYLTNLQRASRTGPGKWKREYRFAREWKATLSVATLAKIDGEIPDDTTVRKYWEQLYVVSSSAQPPFPPNVVRGLYCAIGSLDVASYQSCYCASPGTDASLTPK